MVTLIHKQYRGSKLGYLICERCKGYYELQEGESPEEFDKCLCGGKLRYVENLNENKWGNSTTEKNKPVKGDKIGDEDEYVLETVFLCFILIIATIVVTGFLFSNKTTYATAYNNYTSPVMSFQYPQGWKITPINNNSVEIKKDENNYYQVSYLKSANAIGDESVKLNNAGYDLKGPSEEKTTKISYQVYISPTEDNEGAKPVLYLFCKNSKSYEVKGVISDNTNPNPMDQVIATIK